ncbi:DUF3093 domain-containing protein [Rothia sp. P6271]|uniref:DUF3093 domain-containing protein n=1 Tax=Rothia sp. P6271 TaxID=3402659 RepID=UPI003AC2878D
MSSDSTDVLYYERLSPGFGTWLVAIGVGCASYLVAAPINIPIGIVVGILMMLLVGGVLFVSSPRIEITPRVLRVGRAQIEREYVGYAEAFYGDAARVVAGPALDGRAFMCFRGWIEPKVRIHIVDPADPTPYWLASSRHPERIVEILNEGKDVPDNPLSES